jgi:uncharacterized protein (TIGR00369 family)
MIAQELEVSLHRAFMDGRQRRHEFITVEHLLLALLDNPSASEVLRACAANTEELRKQLTEFINEHTPIVIGDEVDTQPTLGFQRVIQRAILNVQSSGRKEVTGADTLVAIFGEKDSHAMYFLQEKEVTRVDVVNYISHGVSEVQLEGQAEDEREPVVGSKATSFDINVPFVEHLGLKLIEKGEGRALIRFEPGPEHLNSWKGVHGGALMTLLDVALSSAARSLDPVCIGAATVEMKANFLAAATGPILAEGFAQRAGRSLIFAEGAVSDPAGTVLAKASGTFKLVYPKAAKPPAEQQ